MSAVVDLNQLLTEDVAAGREQLRRLFLDGRITLHPDNGAYLARSSLLPMVLLTQRTEPKNRQQRETTVSNDFALLYGSSGGALRRYNNAVLLDFCPEPLPCPASR
jgi:hypothetical protein